MLVKENMFKSQEYDERADFIPLILSFSLSLFLCLSSEKKKTETQITIHQKVVCLWD